MSKIIDFETAKAKKEQETPDTTMLSAAFLAWLESPPEPRRESVMQYDTENWIEPN